MGANESKEILESEEAKLLRQIATEQGVNAVQQYINENRNRWKSEPVKFGITGRSATGKSSFINAMRNVSPGDEQFAKSGSGNTTNEPKAYEDPKNKKIVYYDLPGVATMQFPKEEYIKKMRIYDYDYFFIFFDKVIEENDAWIMTMLKEAKKPFALIRSKIDEDIYNAKYDGKKKEDVIPEIWEKIEMDRNSYNVRYPDNQIDREKIFLISSRDKRLGDMDSLIKHIESSLPSIKFEAVVYSIGSISKEVIEMKYKMLKRRINMVTAAVSIFSALPLNEITDSFNADCIVDEIVHYTRVFGLRETETQAIPENIRQSLKCAKTLHPAKDIPKFVMLQVGKIISSSSMITPLIGCSLTASITAHSVFKFLNRYLDDIKADAIVVSDTILQQQ